MRTIRLIGIDLDGTALNSRKEVTRENRLAFEKCRENGIEIVPVTGRPFSGVYSEYTDAIGCSHCITSNGAVVNRLADGKRVMSHCLDRGKMYELIGILDRFDCYYGVFVDGYGYLENERYFAELRRFEGTPLHEYIKRTRKRFSDREKFLGSVKDCDNIYVIAENTEVRDIIADKIARVEDIFFTSSAKDDVEIGSTCSKGTTLLEYAESIGIKKDEVMAIGDSGNDLDMLKRAGFAVAMENSSQPILDAADFVTKSCEESGVAFAINKLLSGKLF